MRDEAPFCRIATKRPSNQDMNAIDFLRSPFPTIHANHGPNGARQQANLGRRGRRGRRRRGRRRGRYIRLTKEAKSTFVSLS